MKRKILKASGGGGHIMYKGINTMINFSSETMQGSSQWNNILKVLKVTYCPARTVYHTKISFRNKGDIKIRTEINDTENRKTTKKVNENKSWLFESISTNDKPLGQLIREKIENK